MPLPLLLAVVAGCGDRPQNAAPEPAERQQARIAHGELWSALQTRIGADSAQRTFYEDRGREPYWVDAGGEPLSAPGLSDEAESYLEMLAEARSHGLDPQDYDARALHRLAENEPEGAEALAEAEQRFMQSYLRYAEDLAQGRETPSLDEDWHIPTTEFSRLDQLARLQQSGAAGSLRAVMPRLSAYDALRQARAAMLRIVQAGGWPRVEGQGLIRPGDHSAEIPELRKRLAVSGELASAQAQGKAAQDPTLYDEATVQAFKEFQRRHGVEADGIIGDASRAMLNYPAAQRLAQIDANLERLRWLPRELGEDRIMVNIAAYQLEAWAGNEPTLKMPVIVGEEQNQTPAFADTLEYLTVNPYWTVPNSIVVKEIAPKMLADPGYLAQQNMRIYRGALDSATLSPQQIDWPSYADPDADFPYVIRQDPGAGNALGRIKFMFPNQYAIYLHDTPADHLFDRADRTFSHGCIRVGNPVELAAFVLDDTPGWSRQRVGEVMDSGEHTVVSLAEPDRIPVYVYYSTAWAGADGALHFRPDRYGRDAALLAAYASPAAGAAAAP